MGAPLIFIRPLPSRAQATTVAVCDVTVSRSRCVKFETYTPSFTKRLNSAVGGHYDGRLMD